MFINWLIDLNRKVDAIDMNVAVAMSAWHMRVDLSDHTLSNFDGCAGDIDRNAQRAKPMLIRWRNLN